MTKARRKPPSRRGKYDRAVPTEVRHEEQRLKLLDFATQVFAEHGYHETTVELIVKKAGMSRRTFYEHFEDIRDVLSQVYERASTAGFSMVTHRARSFPEPLEQVRQGVVAYFDVVSAFPDVARVIFHEYRLGGADFEARYQEDSMKYGIMLLESLGAAHAAGSIKKAPTEIAVYTLFKGIENLAVHKIMKREHAQLPALSSEVSQLLIDAFQPA